MLFKTLTMNVRFFKHGTRLCVLASKSILQLKDSTWHPEFGKSVANKKVEISFDNGRLQTEIRMIKGLV